MVIGARGRTRSLRLARPSLAIATILLLGGCDLGSTIIPRAEAKLVVHSVLNARVSIQYVLVEESLTGSREIPDTPDFNPGNPIVTGFGVPVSGATVTITDPDGRIMTATEEFSAGRPTGLYRLDLTLYATSIQQGGRYELSVTAQGMTVTGSTVVPRSSAPVGVGTVSFNRDRESVQMSIKDVELARAFWVRVEAPLTAYSLFTTDPKVNVSGDARNIFTEDLIRVFYPGFLQTVTVAAVDTNVYDYYRSGNDPFSGTGLINHLSGGLGLFGSLLRVEQRQYDVTQDPTGDPIEGQYTVRSPTSPSQAQSLQLFVESLGLNGAPDRISGSHTRSPGGANFRGAVYGTRENGGELVLNLLEAQSTDDVDWRFRGVAKGDSLIGTLSNPVRTAVYVRVGK